MTLDEFWDSLFFGWTAALVVMVIGIHFQPFKKKNFIIMVLAGWIGLNVFAATIVLRRMYAG